MSANKTNVTDLSLENEQHNQSVLVIGNIEYYATIAHKVRFLKVVGYVAWLAVMLVFVRYLTEPMQQPRF
jgi:hypothetical protein